MGQERYRRLQRKGMDVQLTAKVDADTLNRLTGLLFANSREAIILVDGSGGIVAMNRAAEEIMGPAVTQELHRLQERAICEACRGYTSETELRTCADCYLNAPDTSNFSSFQVFLETGGKGPEPYTASFQLIDPERGIRAFMLRNQTRQYQAQETYYRNKMIKHVLEAQENERRRISRELHDSVAQELMSAMVDLRVLKYMTQDQSLIGKMQQTKAVLTRLLGDIRNLSVELRPATLDDFGLEAAFRSHFKRLEENYGFGVEFVSELPCRRYPSEIETVIYRVCQEAVLNAMKYAQVDEVRVTLTENEGRLRLTVSDDGAGMTPGAEPSGTGLGLYGMRERTELVGGSFTLDSRQGGGTTITAEVPAAGDCL